MSKQKRIDDLIADFKAGVRLHLEDGRDIAIRGEQIYANKRDDERPPMKREMTVMSGDGLSFIGCTACKWSVGIPTGLGAETAASGAFNDHDCSKWETRAYPAGTLSPHND